MDERWSLAGKRALITGGTKGIGRAIAEEFLRLGAEVAVVARGTEALEPLVRGWRDAGVQAHGIPADVREKGISPI